MIKVVRARKIDPLYSLMGIKGITGEHERETCKGCIYLMPLDPAAEKYKVCHYCYITGFPRGCPVENCEQKIIKKGGKNHDTVPEDVSRKK